MPEPDTLDERANLTVALTRRQVEALRLAAIEEDRSVSYYLRKLVDRHFGFDRMTIDPRESEQEVAK